MAPTVSAGSMSIVLVTIAVGLVVGVLFGGWVLAAAQKCIPVIAKLVLLGGIALVTARLWNDWKLRQASAAGGSAAESPAQSIDKATASPEATAPRVAPRSKRPWWEEGMGE